MAEKRIRKQQYLCGLRNNLCSRSGHTYQLVSVLLLLILGNPLPVFSEKLRQAITIDAIRITVNEQIITDSDLEEYREQLRQDGLFDDMVILSPEERIKAKKNDKTLKELLIRSRLLESEIKRQGIEIPEEIIEERIRGIARNYNLNRAQFEAALKEQGLSIEEYRDFLEGHFQKQELFESQVRSRVRVSEEEVTLEMIENHPDVPAQAYRYKLSQIFISSQRGGEERALERAQRGLERLYAGEPFSSVAASLSDGPIELGEFQPGELAQHIEEIVRNLDPGQFTPVIPIIGQGFHIIYLTDKKLTENKEIERLRRTVRERLTEEAYKRQLRQWLTELRAEAKVRLHPKSPTQNSQLK